LFEKIGNLPNLGAVVSEVDPYFVLVVFGWNFLCMFDFSFLIMGIGNLLLFAIVRIVCHSVFFFFWREG
jgi:hypothetical protein